MDMWMDVDVDLAEVPVNIMPLIDSTDFSTIEDAVAYNAGGMALFWHFVTTAGAYTVTAVTPTTAGTYDWTDQGTAGIYTIEIPASGGASINNDTEGFGWFTGKATGILPWRGPVIGFRAAALNDALIDGGDNLDVNTVQFASQTVTAAAGVTLPTSVASPTNITAGTITTVTNLTNAPTAGDLTATMKTSVTTAATAATPVAASVTGAVGSVTGAVGSVTGAVGSVTARVTANADQLAGQTITAAAGVTFPASVASPTNITAGTITTVTNLTNAPTAGDLTATMKTSVTTAATAATPIAASVTGAVGSVVGHTPQTGDTYALANGANGFVATKADTAAILLDTGTDGVVVAAASKTGFRLSATGVDDVLDEVVLGSYTMRQLLRGFAAALAGKLSGAATTTVTIRSADDSKDVIVATVDASGNRSAVTLDLT